jgi:hypothetical protein
MLDHFRNRLAAGKSSPGLLVVAQRTSIGAVAEAIVTLWAVARPANVCHSLIHPGYAYVKRRTSGLFTGDQGPAVNAALK